MTELDHQQQANRTNGLLDRIAAALKTANDRVAGFIGYDEMADAVIRELGLRDESYLHGGGTRLYRRYVTEWRADDE